VVPSGATSKGQKPSGKTWSSILRSLSYFGGIERGENNVSLINIEKIAEALGAETAELFRG
jgi:transcriptional regulator with XRE-family HTH domain